MSKNQKALKVTVAVAFAWLMITVSLLGLSVIGGLANAVSPIWVSAEFLSSLATVCGMNTAAFTLCVISGALVAIIYATYVHVVKVIDGL